ncbi:hypothetical protein TREES_T100016241 [Tupaia chinensis]|uniref:Uncharacterized protein n=1 Tax=Tupaia chinensis TaxID=246437 RepID=L9JHN9_TUPCH|nr:hypothetical protein TREES_T100016241 [Tupaia chinensis]
MLELLHLVEGRGLEPQGAPMTLPGFVATLSNSKDLSVEIAVVQRVKVAGLQRMLWSLGEGVVHHAHYGVPKSDSDFISSHKAGRADPEQTVNETHAEIARHCLSPGTHRRLELAAGECGSP